VRETRSARDEERDVGSRRARVETRCKPRLIAERRATRGEGREKRTEEKTHLVSPEPRPVVVLDLVVRLQSRDEFRVGQKGFDARTDCEVLESDGTA
jgi:hypothetical protein